MVGAYPENVDAYDDAYRWQQPREECEYAARISLMARSRVPTPEVVGRQRPHADQGEQQHDLFEQGVHCTKCHQHVRDRIAEASRGNVRRPPWREPGRW